MIYQAIRYRLFIIALLCLCNTLLRAEEVYSVHADTSKIQYLLSKIDFFSKTPHSDSALYYSKRTQEMLSDFSKRIRKNSALEKFIIKSYVDLAEKVKNTKDLANMELFYFKALSLAKSKKYIAEECLVVGKLGMYYYSEGDYPSALNYSFQNLKLAEKLNDTRQIAIANNRIGIVYKRQMEHDKAIAYINRSAKLFEALGDQAGVANSINNIGDVYINQKKYKQAFINYQTELGIGLKINDVECIADAYSCIGVVYSSVIDLPHDSLVNVLGPNTSKWSVNNLLDSAAANMEKAKAMYIKLNDAYEISDCLNGIGKIHQLKGQHQEALKAFTNAYSMAKEFGFLEKQKQACLGLYENYVALKQSDQSLKWYVRYSQINDSIFNISKAKDLGRLESKHEFEAKEKQIIADQLHERELANAEKKQQRFILLIVSIGLVLVISLFIYLLTRFRLIKQQNQLIEMQRRMMWEKQKEISDSIHYAERIQRSFLASEEELKKSLGNYFVFFQPKDVVSGDFYWASNLNNGDIAFCCADSTGHGVPGAIMSVLNISSLEKSIETNNAASEILNQTRTTIIERLKKDGSTEGGKDGMDCALLVLNREKSKLYCAAANSPVWILRNGIIIEIAPDKMPVGKHVKDQLPFTQHEMELHQGDIIYALTDGMPDQFGGPKGKKYKYSKLKEFLISISAFSMQEQKLRLEQEFTQWKGDLEQIDDVCIMGVRI